MDNSASAAAAEIEPRRQRGQRGPTMDHDENSPAWRVIYGVFGSIAAFCDKTETPLGTAHGWLVEGLIPSRRQEKIMAKAAEHGIELDPVLFVPRPKAA